MPDVVIRRCLVSDAADLAAFAARTFAAAFANCTSADDMQAHLAATYRPDLQARELADPTVITLLALQDSRIVAYAQLTMRLMQRALAAARELGGRYAWLGVWERNSRAMAFYRKSGFDAIGSTHYVVGSDRQIDRVFIAALSPLHPVTATHPRQPLRTGQA